MYHMPGPAQLLGHEPPTGATLHREGDLLTVEAAKPLPQHQPVRRFDLTGRYFTGFGHEIVVRDLGTVHVKPAYDRHRDLLELLNAHQELLRLCRGGPST
jgi:hypothetical protein